MTSDAPLRATPRDRDQDMAVLELLPFWDERERYYADTEDIEHDLDLPRVSVGLSIMRLRCRHISIIEPSDGRYAIDPASHLCARLLCGAWRAQKERGAA